MERRNKRWGERNLMEIAYIGHLRAFIASKKLCDVWYPAVSSFILVSRSKLSGCDSSCLEERIYSVKSNSLFDRNIFAVLSLDAVGKIPARTRRRGWPS